MVTTARKRFWLTFDLGLVGDYDELYEWLDNHNAEECGGNTATFYYDASIDELSDEMKNIFTDNKKARIYVVYIKENGKHSGRWVLGKRKHSPWAGFGVGDSDEEDN